MHRSMRILIAGCSSCTALEQLWGVRPELHLALAEEQQKVEGSVTRPRGRALQADQGTPEALQSCRDFGVKLPGHLALWGGA